MLARSARYDEILKTPKDGKLGAALIAAMEEIESAYPPLAGQLPKDYSRFDDDVLEGSRASSREEGDNRLDDCSSKTGAGGRT